MKKLIKLLGELKFPLFKRQNLKADAFNSVREQAKVGDVIFSTSAGFFVNILNPSKPYKHAGIISRVEGCQIIVTEAIGKGVVETDLFDFFENKTMIALYSPNMKADMEIVQACVGLPYDYLFKKGNKKYYCFELVAYAFKPNQSIIIERIKVLWQRKYLAQSFINNRNFKLKGEFNVRS